MKHDGFHKYEMFLIDISVQVHVLHTKIKHHRNSISIMGGCLVTKSVVGGSVVLAIIWFVACARSDDAARIYDATIYGLVTSCFVVVILAGLSQ